LGAPDQGVAKWHVEPLDFNVVEINLTEGANYVLLLWRRMTCLYMLKPRVFSSLLQ
jgi:hypothetical protein